MCDVVDDRPVLHLGHSPDPDDAFMWWPLLDRAGGPAPIDTGRFRYRTVTADIETLNKGSEGGKDRAALNSNVSNLEITAISAAQYPYVHDRYAITTCGASMGEGYGPKLIARERMSLADLIADDVVIAVPGERTSAFMTLGLMLASSGGKTRHGVVPFEDIIERVQNGEYRAGLVIHEGQLTFESCGLHLVADLGQWWWAQHQLPLPLGLNVIRQDLEDQHGRGTLQEIASTLRRSIEYAQSHRAQAVEYAMQYGRGIGANLADRFISMYVNHWTHEFGDAGRRAIERLLHAGAAAGLCPQIKSVHYVA